MTQLPFAADIAANLGRIQERIEAAARRSGRNPADITLVAVTKTVPLDVLQLAYSLGLRHFGENRVQEAAGKVAAGGEHHTPDLAEASHCGSAASFCPTWHMIGHLQTNKAKAAAGLFDVVHSVDSLRLAEALDTHARTLGRRLPVLLEVNVAGEASKHGFAQDASFWASVDQILALPSLVVQGLMTVAPQTSDPEAARPVFRGLNKLRQELRHHYPHLTWPHLSMGMTDDFEVAVEEGATLLRLGRAIFGERTGH